MKQFVSKAIGFLFLIGLVSGMLWSVAVHQGPIGAPPDRQEVLFWHFWGGRDLDVVRDVVARFNRSQGRFWVREVAMPGNNMRAKLFLSAAGGKPPDLINIDDPVIADWSELGLLHSLPDVIGATETNALSQWMLPAARRLSEVDGKLWGICNGLDVRALYYNQTALEQLGLPFPSSLEEFDCLCAEAEDRLRKSGAGLFAFLPNPRRLIHFAYLFGGQVWQGDSKLPTLDDPGVASALTWVQSFTIRHGADRMATFRQTEQSLPGKSFPLLPTDSEEMVGRYLMVLDGQWRTREIKAFLEARAKLGKPAPAFATAPLPAPKSGTPNAGWVNGNVFVFPKRARQSAGAVEFAKFWVGFFDSTEAAKTCIDGGWIPVSQAVIDEPTFQQHLESDRLFSTFVRLAADHAQRPTPMVRDAALLSRLLETTAERVAFDPRLDPATELRAANQEFQRQRHGVSLGGASK